MFHWEYAPPDVDCEPSGDFASQAQAEEWFASFWADLAESGVTSVTLVEEDRVVYGPMGLDAI